MLYRPAAPGSAAGAVSMVVRARGDATSLTATVGRVAAETDPTLRLYEVMPLDDIRKADGLAYDFFLRVLAIVSAVALLLSTAGVYSLMSFTLSRRTREIGIRVALGAAPRSIIRAIFSRAFGQIGLGILAGSVPGYLLVAFGAPEMARGGGTLLGVVATVAIAAFIAGVTALACLLPARRALRIPADRSAQGRRIDPRAGQKRNRLALAWCMQRSAHKGGNPDDLFPSSRSGTTRVGDAT